MVVALGSGAVVISPTEVAAILLGQLRLEHLVPYDERQAVVLTGIRLPRVLATAIVGAAWGAAGMAMQGLYRTPLADPALVAIGAGAALGAALGTATAVALGLATTLGGLLLVVATASALALVAAALIDRVARASGLVAVSTMLLAGMALTALFGAFTALVVAGTRSIEIGGLADWSLGSFAGIVGQDVIVGALVTLPIVALLARLGPRLDALALGDAEASHLGVAVPRLRIMVSVLFALLTGLAVAIAGVIAFVGLVAPALARSLVGRAHRVAVIGAALLGAIALVVADLLARSLMAPVEVPVGVITTIVGAPFFLWLLLRDHGRLTR
jgi:iron complex transport system permease protein